MDELFLGSYTHFASSVSQYSNFLLHVSSHSKCALCEDELGVQRSPSV